MPGSPMPDGSQRASPMNYNPMGPGMENGMRAGANGMQPPSSHPGFQNGATAMNPQMQAMRAAQGGPMVGGPGFQPGQQGQMAPGAQQPGANGNMGTPRQANAAMPPPQGPPPAQNATGRAPSPAPSAAASTPQTTNKPNPKKKESKKDRKVGVLTRLRRTTLLTPYSPRRRRRTMLPPHQPRTMTPHRRRRHQQRQSPPLLLLRTRPTLTATRLLPTVNRTAHLLPLPRSKSLSLQRRHLTWARDRIPE